MKTFSKTHKPVFPALRWGEEYVSFDVSTVKHVVTGDELADVCMVNAGIPRRDLLFKNKPSRWLDDFTSAQLIQKLAQAGDLFFRGDVELIDGYTQSVDDFVKLLSGSTGLPESLCKLNMEKIYYVMANTNGILKGLTRGLDSQVFDTGFLELEGVPVCFYKQGEELAVILPSNSPGVNALWLPALAMKVPVVLKPGREDPWTPFRLVKAMIQAGIPKEAFCFYPTDHEGSEAIVQLSGRSIVFGGDATVKKYEHNPNVETHGTGRSKILIGDDEIENWRDHLDIMVKSIAANGGRSCINTSCIVVPKYADEIADALAEKLAQIEPRALEDAEAGLSGFANQAMPEWIDDTIQEGLKEPGAVDITQKFWNGKERRVSLQGLEYLRPTLIRCESLEHPLGNTEYLFPYASVVEMPQNEMLSKIGFSLVVTAITNHEEWKRDLLECLDIDRLNFGPVLTCVVEWEQPHEGNLFEFLFRRRALMKAG
ncbi:MAG: aldehyde dehydrogenase family protein [Verrucomicrobiota bacterium]